MSKGHIAFKRGYSYMEWSIVSFFDESAYVNDAWTSPTFHFSNATWFLQLYPNGFQSNNRTGQIFLYLAMKESESEFHNVSFRLGIKTKKDIQYKSISCTSRFNKVNNLYGAILLTRSEILSVKTELFPDGVMTFFCEASVGVEKTVDAETQTSLHDECRSLTRDYKDFFLSEEGTDVTIKLKDQEIRVHSQILSARSSVFAPMFKHDTKEKNTGVVEIPEFEPDAFKEFLIFLYTGKTEQLSSDNVVDLYSAADKYDVKELKTVCSEFMKENINVDSFSDALSLAIRYGDKDLMEFLTDYFIKNVKKITVTVKWMSVVKVHPIESNELVIKLAHNLLPD